MTEFASAAPRYTVTRLFYSPGGEGFSHSFDINNSGQVVGRASVSEACLWSNGSLTTIGPPSGFWGCGATAINDSGQIALTCYATNNADRAAIWDHGSLTQNLGTLDAPFNFGAYARSINNKGQAVGMSLNSAGGGHAFFWNNGVTTDIGGLVSGGGSDVFAINDSAQVVGHSWTSTGLCHAIRWNANGMTDLGTLPGYAASTAYDINASGQMVGSSRTGSALSEPGHAVYWSPSGNITDLGMLPGYTKWCVAFGINDGGDIVGASANLSKIQHAFIYSNGTMTDLNTLIDPDSGWTLSYAGAINNSGQIVGYGTFGGQGYGYLLTPVPEPSTFCLLAIAAISLITTYRRRRAA